jgi:hypothetical protein
MNWKLIFLGIVVVGLAVWLLQGWMAANKQTAPVNVATTTNIASTPNTPPVTYVTTSATSTATEMVLDIHANQSTATLRGLGYAALPLKASSTASGQVYYNDGELLRASLQGNQLQVWIAEANLFTGVAATTTPVQTPAL